jgi:hypothetical protein
MTREEIIERMGWMPVSDYEMSEMLDRIERIVAAAVEAEREAICELADNLLRTSDAVALIDAIRARGSK